MQTIIPKPLEFITEESLNKKDRKALLKLAGQVLDMTCKQCQTKKYLKEKYKEKSKKNPGYFEVLFCLKECPVGGQLKQIGIALDKLPRSSKQVVNWYGNSR